MKPIIIADSGSTKTDWAVLASDGSVSQFSATGLNPCVQSDRQIANSLKEEVLPHLHECGSAAVFFYGAGCRGGAVQTMTDILAGLFRPERTEVCSDLLGAARALCGNDAGIACIMGTGSNSCLYDGKEIVQNVPPLGYVLGDEGSGAVLGKRLLGNILKHRMSDETTKNFMTEYPESVDTLIRKVYREPLPNRFLASLVPFIHRNRNSLDIRSILLEEFHLFFKRNIDYYGHPELPVHFIGSVAHFFKSELAEAARHAGYTVGRVLRSPLPGLIAYHREAGA